MTDLSKIPHRHQKERALALMAANGFVLFQLPSDLKRGALVAAITSELLFAQTSVQNRALGFVLTLTLMAAPGVGLIYGYEALRRADDADATSDRLRKKAENKLRVSFACAAVAVTLSIVSWAILLMGNYQRYVLAPQPTPSALTTSTPTIQPQP